MCIEGIADRIESSCRVVDLGFRAGREFSLLVVSATDFTDGVFREGRVMHIDTSFCPQFPVNVIGSHGELWRFHPSEVIRVVWK